MIARSDIFKCSVCGNIVDVVHPSSGQLVCCGKSMNKLIENTVEASTEKHIPVVTTTPYGLTVDVGSVKHPMEEKHYI